MSDVKKIATREGYGIALKELGETHVSALTERADIPPYKIRAVLSSLEVKGLAVSLGGNRYAPL